MHALRILYSAYACEPGKGSEPGIGWHWAIETAGLGHQVWVITRSNNQPAIEAATARGEVPANLHFVYYDLPAWTRWWKRGGRGVHLYYVLWQWGAWHMAHRLHARERFTAVHHITFGVMRHPIFMNRLGIPCVVGPLGGGERAPLALRQHYPFKDYCAAVVRDMANAVAHFDPWVRRMYAQASLILAKTPDTLRWFDAPYRNKAECMLEVGIQRPCGEAPERAARPAGTLRALYVGRFIPFKGMGLGLRALAALRERGIDANLTMIGQGPQQENWQWEARGMGLSPHVVWRPWLRQEDLLKIYRDFDVLLFPSLSDSSGNVVLESLANGLPVVCLDLGGPAQIVNRHCGRVVSTEGLEEEGVVRGLADALKEIADDVELARRLRRGAVARARQFAWRAVVSRVWGPEGRGTRLVEETLHGRAHGLPMGV